MAAPRLPLSEFLALLRARGLPIGLVEYQDVERLLSRWQGTQREELRDALAALLARSTDEVQRVRALFDELYPPETAAEPAPPSPGPAFPPPEPEPGAPRANRGDRPAVARTPRGVLLVLALAVLLVGGGLTIGLLLLGQGEPADHTPPSDAAAQALGTAPPERDPAFPDAAPPRDLGLPPLPPPVQRPPSVPPMLVLLLGFGIPLAALHRQRLRSARRRRAEAALTAAYEALPGPDSHAPMLQARLRLGAPLSTLSREDIEEFATLLHRLCVDHERGTEIDVERTVERVARTGLLLQPALRTVLLRQPIVCLEDVSRSSQLFAFKLEPLLAGLVRGGVPLIRYTFDGSAQRVMTRRGPAQPLAEVLAQHPEAPILLLGVGTQASGSEPAAWHEPLAGRRHAWLLPLDAPPPSTLRARFPGRVFALSRSGLRGAAYALASEQDRLAPPGRSGPRSAPRHATLAELAELLRLVALLPQPSVELVEWLRQRFCPQIPESVLLAVIAQSTTLVGPQGGVRLPAEEAARRRAELRAADPQLERGVRRAFCELLRTAEPPHGSVACYRWQAELLGQTAHSLDPDSAADREVVPRLVHELTELARSPFHLEARATLAALGLCATPPRQGSGPPILPLLTREWPGTPALREALIREQEAARSTTARGPVQGWLPGLRELALAALLAGIVGLVAHALDLTSARAVPHVRCITLALGPSQEPAGSSNQLRPAPAWTVRPTITCAAPLAEYELRSLPDGPGREQREAAAPQPEALRIAVRPASRALYAVARLGDGRLAYSRLIEVPGQKETAAANPPEEPAPRQEDEQKQGQKQGQKQERMQEAAQQPYDVPASNRQVVVFEPQSAKPTAAGQLVLRLVGQWLKKHPVETALVGYEAPQISRPELSRLRVNFVSRYLTEKASLPARLLSIQIKPAPELRDPDDQRRVHPSQVVILLSGPPVILNPPEDSGRTKDDSKPFMPQPPARVGQSPRAELTGEVVLSYRADDGSLLLTLNRGTEDGVRSGMRGYILRSEAANEPPGGGGTFTVTKVTDRQAVATLRSQQALGSNRRFVIPPEKKY